MILPIILLSNIAVINFSSDPCNYRCKQKEIENIVDIINGLVRCDSVIYTRLNNNMRSLEKLVPEEIVHNLHHNVFYELIPYIKQEINTFLTPNFWDCKKNSGLDLVVRHETRLEGSSGIFPASTALQTGFKQRLTQLEV